MEFDSCSVVNESLKHLNVATLSDQRKWHSSAKTKSIRNEMVKIVLIT